MATKTPVRSIVLALVVGVLLPLAPLITSTAQVPTTVNLAAQTSYDAYGYDYAGRRFNGLYENADRDTSNNTGDPTALQMEWSDGLNLLYPEISQPGSWVTNFQKGTYVGQDGNTYRWSYSVKLTYTGSGSPVLGYFTKAQETYVDAAGTGATPQYRPPVLPAPGP